MIPTGFKLYAGIAFAALAAAALGGWTSGDSVIGPLSAGYKGGIGDYVSYTVLVGVALVSISVGTLLSFFRDADAEAVASSMGTGVAPVGQRPVAATVWPIVAGLGVTALIVGMALNTFVTGVGIVLLAIVALEWTMTAWADRATGDPATNLALRNQLMGPMEVPLLGLLGGAVLVMAISRVFLATAGTGAVVIGSIVSLVILGLGILFVNTPNMSKNAITAMVGALVLIVLGGGIWGLTQSGHAEEGEEESHSEEAMILEVAE